MKVTWTEDPAEGTIGAALIDPFGGGSVGPAQTIDIDEAGTLGFSFVFGWAGQDDPPSLVATRVYSNPDTTRDLIAFDVVGAEIVWRGEAATVTSEPTLGDHRGSFLQQGPRGAARIAGAFSWSSMTSTCFGSLSVPESGAPGIDPSCITATFDPDSVTLNGRLATLILRRAGEFFDLFQQPLGPEVDGTPVVPLARQLLSEGGPPLVSMYRGRGAIAYTEPSGPADGPRVRLQRIGCE